MDDMHGADPLRYSVAETPIMQQASLMVLTGGTGGTIAGMIRTSTVGFSTNLASQYIYSQSQGKDFLSNYNVISGTLSLIGPTNSFTNNPYVSSYLGSQFSLSLAGGLKVNSFESAVTSSLVSGTMNFGFRKFVRPELDKISMEKLNTYINVSTNYKFFNPGVTMARMGFGVFSSVNGKIAGQLVEEGSKK